MALILTNNRYLKIDIHGNFIIYKNKAGRSREKQSTNVEIVKKKYIEVLQEFNTDEYLRYHEKTGLEQQWQSEYCRYIFNLINHVTTDDYPLMQQYIPDVNKTIPNIISYGKIGVPFIPNSVADVYEYIKKYEIFDKIENIKDA